MSQYAINSAGAVQVSVESVVDVVALVFVSVVKLCVIVVVGAHAY
jgi:hypothetical protein